MKRQIILLFAAVMAIVCAETALGGDVPEAWTKARTLMGVATRATANPLQGTFELKCGKANGKGLAKVSAKLTGLDGKKKSYKAKAPIDVTVVPVTADLGGIVVTIDGDSFSGGDGLPGGLTVKPAKVGGALANGEHTFNIEDFNPGVPGRLQRDLLPLYSQFDVVGGKWKFAKGASVKWRKPKKGEEKTPLYDWETGKDLMVDTSKGTNLSSLKLTYKPKTGQFKGSFKVYSLEGEGKATKLKTYTVKVNGFVVDGEGVGQATCKKLAGGPWVATVDDSHVGVQLWAGGPYWATMNIGAEKPEDYGCYFWWGDTNGYRRVNDVWVASDGSPLEFRAGNTLTYGKAVYKLEDDGWVTVDDVLVPEHDAAQVHLGGDWRMPTKQEFEALITNCDCKWTTQKGVNGYEVRGKGVYASASIFLPAAGFGDGALLREDGAVGDYWSSVPQEYNYNAYAWELYFTSSDAPRTDDAVRCYGFPVRPVKVSTK